MEFFLKLIALIHKNLFLEVISLLTDDLLKVSDSFTSTLNDGSKSPVFLTVSSSAKFVLIFYAKVTIFLSCCKIGITTNLSRASSVGIM